MTETKAKKNTKKAVAGLEAKVYTQAGKEAGTVALPAEIFETAWNADLVHQVVIAMQANLRTPVAHTKTRGEVRGGGKKPWRQKGTGRARHGSTRSPIWVGGGVAHGPRNDKSYKQKINKKAKAKALYTILAKKFADNEILFVDKLSFAAPKAKDAKEVLSSFSGIKGFEKFGTKKTNTALIAVEKKGLPVEKSFANFSNVMVDEVRNMNPLLLSTYKYIVIENPKESLGALAGKLA